MAMKCYFRCPVAWPSWCRDFGYMFTAQATSAGHPFRLGARLKCSRLSGESRIYCMLRSESLWARFMGPVWCKKRDLADQLTTVFVNRRLICCHVRFGRSRPSSDDVIFTWLSQSLAKLFQTAAMEATHHVSDQLGRARSVLASARDFRFCGASCTV